MFHDDDENNNNQSIIQKILNIIKIPYSDVMEYSKLKLIFLHCFVMLTKIYNKPLTEAGDIYKEKGINPNNYKELYKNCSLTPSLKLRIALQKNEITKWNLILPPPVEAFVLLLLARQCFYEIRINKYENMDVEGFEIFLEQKINKRNNMNVTYSQDELDWYSKKIVEIRNYYLQLNKDLKLLKIRMKKKRISLMMI